MVDGNHPRQFPPPLGEQRAQGKRQKMAENQSEVARLLAQIGMEYEAAQRGLTGLASGTSNHQFITARLERISDLHTSLQDLVGESATALLAEHLQAIPDIPAAPRIENIAEESA
jgi:hypothetical protein